MSRKEKKPRGDKYLGNCPTCNLILSARDLTPKGVAVCPVCETRRPPDVLEKPKPPSVFEDWDGIQKERSQAV